MNKTTRTLLLLAATWATTTSITLADERPNVVILYADDMGYGDLAVNNPDSKIPTPHLDRLASEGLRFTDGHSSSGICTPSRYAMLTGRYHWRKFHGISQSFGESMFDDEELTLPEMLQSQGYHTAHIGKWHLGMGWEAIRNPEADDITNETKPGKGTVRTPESYDWSQPIPDGPTAHGFDYSFTDCVINFPPYCWIENDKVLKAPDRMMDPELWKPLKEGNWECRPGPMVTGWDPYDNLPTLTKQAVKYIETQAANDKPFFLYFALPAPHAPIVPSDEFVGSSQAGPYGDYVVESDDACGQLVDALKRSGVADNTIVIFTADNGAENYAFKRDQTFDHWSSTPFRGAKRYIYEGGHHVPFIVKWPSVTKPGSVSTSLVSQIDIMGTLAALTGFELPDDQALDSHNLLPLIQGTADEVRTVHVHNTYQDIYGIRQGDWVLLNSPKIDKRGSAINKAWATKHDYPSEQPKVGMLYNLKTDIGQKHDVSTEHPEKVASLTELLEKIRQQGHSAPRLTNQ